jgi:hypothetical protein
LIVSVLERAKRSIEFPKSEGKTRFWATFWQPDFEIDGANPRLWIDFNTWDDCRLVEMLASSVSHNLEPALIITRRLQNEQGVIHVMAEEIVGLPALGLPEQASRNYH